MTRLLVGNWISTQMAAMAAAFTLFLTISSDCLICQLLDILHLRSSLLLAILVEVTFLVLAFTVYEAGCTVGGQTRTALNAYATAALFVYVQFPSAFCMLAQQGAGTGAFVYTCVVAWVSA